MNLVNGIEIDTVSAYDRGLMYGDGVFRTLAMRRGRPLLWPRHYAKLAADCKALRIDCAAADIFERDLAAIAARQSDCVVKIVVTRGCGPRGYAILDATAPTRIVAASALPVYPQSYCDSGVRVHLCRTRLALQPALAGIKHLNRLENVLGRSEWSDPEIAEGLMCDIDGNVICGTMSNVFLVTEGVLQTPQLARCGVAGVQRERVLELAQANDVQARLCDISIGQLLAADELFVVNSVIGVWQVVTLDRRTWKVGLLTMQIRAWLEDAQER